MNAKKAYEKHRYHSHYDRNFRNTVNSHVNILRKLGCTVILPDSDQLDAAIVDYLANRPRRERIDWGAEG